MDRRHDSFRALSIMPFKYHNFLRIPEKIGNNMARNNDYEHRVEDRKDPETR